MKKGLYWKIFIGLILGLAYGVIFPTNYKITDNTITHFEKLNLPGELVIILQNEKKDFTETETEFLKRLKPALGPQYYEKYKKDILLKSKYNPYLIYISWFGELFIRALKMIIFPLIIVAVIAGMSNLSEDDKLGLLSIKTILYFIVASSLAIIAGLAFANIFMPGNGIDIGSGQYFKAIPSDISLSDSILEIVPENIFESLNKGNLLSIIFFSILFGYFITKVNDRNRILLGNFFSALNDVLIKLTNFIIRFTPIGVFALMSSFSADLAGDYQKLLSITGSLGSLILTMLAGLLFHSFVSLPLLMMVGFRISPWKHFKALRCALITAFSTSSPLATLSITMTSVQKNCGVSKKISSFALPLGTALIMDGTALFVSVSTLFIAQANGIELSILDQLVVLAISLLVSIGASGIQLNSLTTITIILTAIGLPLEGISLILSVDILLGMFRNAVTVWSHSCGAVIIAKSEGETLKV